ncbi:MAG: Holliday junction branch migration protein RuvA [Actinomycetia bacterium]|nr:Holliday junction branch migration protein RuvA [Actinomycetes bacterium]
MIQFVRGEVAQLGNDHVVLDVSGIGIRVEASTGTTGSLQVGDAHQIPTSLIVREDSWTLYGFADDADRAAFDVVQSVSGIGPKTAQGLISTLSADGLQRAVAAADEKALMQVSGIGRKGAQRIILELADKLTLPTGAAPSKAPGEPAAEQQPWRADVHSGLVSLGWSSREAGTAIDLVVTRMSSDVTEPESLSVASMMRAALLELNRS